MRRQNFTTFVSATRAHATNYFEPIGQALN